MENKNIIRTFRGFKFSKNEQWDSLKFYGSYKQSIETLGELQDIQVSKGKKVNKLWRKLFDQH